MSVNLLKGHEFRTVFRFTIPLILGAFIQQFYSLADCLVVGNTLGSEALAAIGATGTSIFFIMSLSNGLSGACSVIVAQYFGADNEQMTKTSIISSLYYSLCCSMLISVFGALGTRSLLQLLRTPEPILEQATQYLQICMGFSIGSVFYNNAASVIRALGDSRTPFAVLVFASVMNIMLDIIFITRFGLGVAGAAIATVIAQTISAVICIAYIIKKLRIFHIQLTDLYPNYQNIGAIAAIGVPMGLQSSVLAVGDMILTSTINSFGDTVVSAYAVANRIHECAIVPFLQFAIGFSTFAAQNMGARQLQRIKRTMLKSVLFVSSAALIAGCGIAIYFEPIIKVFLRSDDMYLEAVVQIAGDFLRFVPLLYPFIALIWLYNYTLQGLGKVKVPIISGIIELVSKIVLPYVLGQALGYMGVWYGYPLCWILGWIPSAFYYHSGRWHNRSSTEENRR